MYCIVEKSGCLRGTIAAMSPHTHPAYRREDEDSGIRQGPVRRELRAALHTAGFLHLGFATSTVGLAPVANADHFDGVRALVPVDEAPGANTEAIERRVEALKLLDISSAGFQVAVERLEQVQRSVTGDRPDI